MSLPKVTTKHGNNIKTDTSWDAFHNWMHCICVVTFDLELGQALEAVFPENVNLTKQEESNVCYLAFPDSNSGCMGDTRFSVRLQSSGNNGLEKEHERYNSKCPITLQINTGYYWGYVYFRQVKDITLPRGYFQKSVIILSRLPFNHLFSEVCKLIAPEYFDHGNLSLETACNMINTWAPPVPGSTVNLPLMGTVFQTTIPHQSNGLSNNHVISLNSENHLQIPVEDVNLFQILQPVLSHIHLLWELVITSEPLVIMASSPTHCSAMVLALTKLISPLKYCADYRPYFTIHDSEFKQFTSKMHGPPPVILGVTNPFFAKTLHHWPHTIKLSDDYGQMQTFKLKKSASPKMLDASPGVYTSYKTFLQKDKHIIKKLVNGIVSKRPLEAQSALLRQHLLQLTQSFMIPLERYIAGLMPLQKEISPFKAAPTPLPFNPDDFFGELETVGPQLTSRIKGDWLGLYKKFLKSENFNDWYNRRYTSLAHQLQTLQLEVLANADLKSWVQGKPEVEVIDMVLRIRGKISKYQENNIPVTNRVREQLHQRLRDIIESLPEDLKNVVQIT